LYLCHPAAGATPLDSSMIFQHDIPQSIPSFYVIPKQEGPHVGAGAVVIPNIIIGKWVTIGAGAVIIKDIPDFAVVVGNPGRVIKINSELEN